MGKYMIILIFLLIAIAVVFATYNLSIIRSMPPEERYKLLYFKDDQVSIGFGLMKRTYKLKDIREVRFSKGKKIPQHGQLGRQNANLQTKWQDKPLDRI